MQQVECSIDHSLVCILDFQMKQVKYNSSCIIFLDMLTVQQQQKAIGALLQKKENALCADCGGKWPCWASLDFGVFVCMNCAGAHRALGPSITRVKSTKLDTWHRDWLENMRIGNSILNEYYEKQLISSLNPSKPNINTPLPEIIKYVHQKYVQKRFADSKQNEDPLKRSKMKQNEKKCTHEIQPKIEPKVPKRQAPKTQNKTVTDCPFTAFDAIIANQLKIPKKAAENLITFDCQAKKSQTIENQPPIIRNQNQFNTISGYKPKIENDLFISFDNFIKNKDASKACLKSKITSQNYLNTNNPTRTVNMFVPTQNVPHYEKCQYSTMNGNFSTSSKPFSSSINQFSANYQQAHHFSQRQQNNSANAHQAMTHNSSQNQKHVRSSMNITLACSIDLDANGNKESVGVKSWVDEWK